MRVHQKGDRKREGGAGSGGVGLRGGDLVGPGGEGRGGGKAPAAVGTGGGGAELDGAAAGDGGHRDRVTSLAGAVQQGEHGVGGDDASGGGDAGGGCGIDRGRGPDAEVVGGDDEQLGVFLCGLPVEGDGVDVEVGVLVGAAAVDVVEEGHGDAVGSGAEAAGEGDVLGLAGVVQGAGGVGAADLAAVDGDGELGVGDPGVLGHVEHQGVGGGDRGRGRDVGIDDERHGR